MQPTHHHIIEKPSPRRSKSKTGAKIAIATMIIAASLGAVALANATGPMSADKFVRNAAIGGTFEIQSSKLALKRSHNDAVRSFAQDMIDDHSKAGNKLKATVETTDVDPKLANDKLDAKHQAMLDKLKNDSDADFDKDYIEKQAAAHKEAVSLFENYSKHGQVGPLKNFATETLPTLEMHKQHIDDLKS